MTISTSLRASVMHSTLLLAMVLSACGNRDEKKTPTQVAAKVGSEEISVHQINQVLSRANTAGASPQTIESMRKDVLEKLIDQQLAVDQAMELKLHRSPEVVAQVEAARREVLSRAYIQQLASSLPPPSPEDAKKYFFEHPQLFSERRVFNLQEIQIPSSTDASIVQQLRAMVAAGKPLEDVAMLLRARGIKFGGGAASRSAEQIPLEILAKVHAMKDGQMSVFDGPQTLTILRLASSQSAPVTEAAAQPRIVQFLTNQRSAEAIARNIKDLRAKAKITYTGNFAPQAGAVRPSNETPLTTGVPSLTTPSASSLPSPAASEIDAKTQSSIEKGVAGLK